MADVGANPAFRFMKEFCWENMRVLDHQRIWVRGSHTRDSFYLFSCKLIQEID